MTKQNLNTSEVRADQVASKKYQTIKLGLDVHADSIVVVRILENSAPQPAQRFAPAKFLEWVQNQVAVAEVVHTCYEAGPFGFVLHRQLSQLGVRNLVVQPVCLDEHHKGVNHDPSDARELVQRLDRYVQGNQKALAVIRVPTIQEEQQRVESRHREQLQKDRQTHEAQGRSLLLYQGYRVMGRWWKETAWQRLKKELPFWLGEVLENLRVLILSVDSLLREASQKMESQAQEQPRGFGLLTSEVLRREVLDWHRFRNRRQVASLTGMCPGVRASGPRSVSGPITKHGNPRLRRALVELAWRVVRYQPRYGPVVRWKEVLQQRQNRGGRKKAIIAIGRRLAIDLWRLETGRCTTRDLQLS